MELKIGVPSQKQELFLGAKEKYIAYGGARGGGKSWAVRSKAKLMAVNYPGITILIVRRTYPELQKNHINALKGEIPLDVATYNSQEKTLYFCNGSRIIFHYCRNDADLSGIQGTEYDVIFIDEATQLTEYQIKQIRVCIRGINTFPKRMYITCNPGGQGHAYVKRVYIDRNFNSNENPDDYQFIQALVTDNEVLMKMQPDYLDQLEDLPEALRQAWRYGRWDVFEGQVFTDFVNDPKHYQDRQWTHVIDPFPIPSEWPIYRGYDHGYAKPFSVGWYAVGYDGIIYRFKEMYGCTREPNVGVQWDIGRIASEIREREETHPQLKGRKIRGIADPAIFQQNGGESIADTLLKYQIYFDGADNKRIPGKMQCHYRLAFDKESGFPMFQVFNTCKHFIRCIPALIYSETDPEDVDTKMEDHNYDEWRYVMMHNKIKPTVNLLKGFDDDNELDEDPLDLKKIERRPSIMYM